MPAFAAPGREPYEACAVKVTLGDRAPAPRSGRNAADSGLLFSTHRRLATPITTERTLARMATAALLALALLAQDAPIATQAPQAQPASIPQS